jgi:large subunit ribosomal protein L31
MDGAVEPMKERHAARDGGVEPVTERGTLKPSASLLAVLAVENEMKKDIHPDYRPVVFHDTTSGESWITRSTMATEETTTWEDGNEYPLAKVSISSTSHPFFTGTMSIVDTAGRVERFERRYGKRKRAADQG